MRRRAPPAFASATALPRGCVPARAEGPCSAAPYPESMNWGGVWTVVGAILAIVVAWIVVSVMMSLVWLVFRIVLVLVVGAVIFFWLRHVFARRERDRQG